MEPKEKKEMRLILKAQQINDDIIYSVKFSTPDIVILRLCYDFKSLASHDKTTVLKEITTVITSLPHFSFILLTKEDSPKEEIDFMNEVYDMLINNGNDVLFEEC